jgi:drug/metabolite transporter (DMT)-like permease
LLVAVGGYALHLDELRRGWAGPVLALVRDRGARMMLAAAAIYAVTSALGKRGVVLSSPGTMAAYYFLAVALLGLPALAPRPSELRRILAKHAAVALAIGVAYTLHLFVHMLAVSAMPAAEMIAIKRTSLLLGSLAGVVLLDEPAPRGRLAGATLMLAGAIWIGLT